MKLRTDTQKRMMSHYFKFNRGAILRMDMATTMSTFSIGRQTGILSANECREKLDMNPYDGGDEYENPNISVKDPKDPNAEPATDPKNTLAVDAMLRSLIQREVNDIATGCKRPNFVNWIDANYPKWERKLADKLESINIDRDAARLHCEESRDRLLQVAGRSTVDTLAENVASETANWELRINKLKGGNHGSAS